MADGYVGNRTEPIPFFHIFVLSFPRDRGLQIMTDSALLKTTAVRIPSGRVFLNADLAIPAEAKVVVAFAHGSGSGRHSPRNRYVAQTLNGYKFATLLADLLTEEEEIIDMRTRHLRFDIPMLADRLIDIAAWLQREPQTKHLKIGWFGASTGAGAALIAAARRPENIMAVVSRGGRPDLAGDDLSKVITPVLLIVGENDPQVIDLNEWALSRLNAQSKLEIVPGATHLFEEPGTLESAALLAATWFQDHAGS
jgi:putative phosphoribosyl transferase